MKINNLFLSLLCLLVLVVSECQISKAEDLHSLAVEAGLGRLELVNKKGENMLPLQLKTQKVCSFGDFDALYLDASYSEYPLTLLTLEDLSAGKSKLYDSVILSNPKQDFLKRVTSEKGYSYELKLGKIAKPTVLGIYLCLDSKKEGRCHNKSYEDINDVIKRYDVKEKIAASYRSTDKIYFFSFFVINEGEIYYPLDSFTEPQYEKLAKFLQYAIKGDVSSLVKRIKELNDVLNSEPLGKAQLTEGGEDRFRGFSISFPKMDQEKCIKGADK